MVNQKKLQIWPDSWPLKITTALEMLSMLTEELQWVHREIVYTSIKSAVG